MCNKARFVHKILASGRAPIYLSTKLLINQSSRNSSRKLNVPIPKIDLYKSSLVYSGPALWNSLPSELRLPFSPSVSRLKSVLCFICISLRCYVKPWSLIYLSPCAASNLCCAASGSPYLLCVCVLCACSFRFLKCVGACVLSLIHIWRCRRRR